MSKRFLNAYYIQQGASNPSGVARTLVEAIDEVRAELPNTGDVRRDAACRMICHQLAFLLNVSEYDRDFAAYHRDYGELEKHYRQSQAGEAKDV